MVGAVGTACHYLLFISLVEGISLAPVPSSIAGYIMGAFVNYALNYRVTFRSDKNHAEAARAAYSCFFNETVTFL